MDCRNLSAAARKQGFDSLAEVNQCVLEPGGTLTFVARKPDTDDVRHQEVMKHLASLRDELAGLQKLRGGEASS